MSGTVTEPWQFYLWFSLVAAIGNGSGLQPRAHHGPKVVHRQKGPRLRHHHGRFDRRPRRAVPGARLAAHPEPWHLWRAQRHSASSSFVTIAASALFLKAPEAGWLPEGFRGPQGRRAPAPSATSPRARWSRPRASGSSSSPSPFAATAGTLLVGKVASIAAVQLFAEPTRRRGRRPRRCGRLRQHLRQLGRPSVPLVRSSTNSVPISRCSSALSSPSSRSSSCR